MWGADATQLQMGSGQPFTIKSFFFFFKFIYLFIFKNTLPPPLKWERCQAWRSVQKAQNTDLIRPRTAKKPDLTIADREVLMFPQAPFVTLQPYARNRRPTGLSQQSDGQKEQEMGER